MGQCTSKNGEASNGVFNQMKKSEFCFSNIDPLTAVGVVGVLGLVMYNGYNNLFKKSSERSEDQPSSSDTPKAAKVAKAKETTNDVKPKRVYRELDTLG